MLNPFEKSNLGFSDIQLIRAINDMPTQYRRLGELNLFPVSSVSRTNIMVERELDVLNVLEFLPRGAPGSVAQSSDRDIRSFVIPHAPHTDYLTPEDVQDIRAVGLDEVTTVSDVLVKKLMLINGRHETTLERMRAGALKGVISNADGTVMIDLFKEFKINEKEIDFVLGTPGTDVPTKLRQVKRHIEMNLRGEMMTGIRALCSPEFFDQLINHAEVKEVFKQQQSSNLIDDVRMDFKYQGILFEEYVGEVSLGKNNIERLIPEGDCRFFPIGTSNTFWTYFAPGNFMDTVNTPGLSIYIRQKELDHQKGIEIYSESNPLAICQRPALLVRGFSSN